MVAIIFMMGTKYPCNLSHISYVTYGTYNNDSNGKQPIIICIQILSILGPDCYNDCKHN